MSNLVELIEEKLDDGKGFCLDELSSVMADRILSVVKEHIGEVAEVCPACWDSGIKNRCSLCHGDGVIARTEGDV